MTFMPSSKCSLASQKSGPIVGLDNLWKERIVDLWDLVSSAEECARGVDWEESHATAVEVLNYCNQPFLGGSFVTYWPLLKGSPVC